MSDDCILLWRNFKQGDEKALEAIFLMFHKELFQYGYKIAMQSAMVDDCIQDLFLELWQSRERLADNISLKAYLFRALKYKLMRAMKKGQNISSLETTSYEGEDFSYEASLIR